MIKALVLDFGGVLFPVQPYIDKLDQAKFYVIKQLVIDIYSENEQLIKNTTYTKELFQKQLQEKGRKSFSDKEIKLIERSILEINLDLLAVLKKISSKYSIFALVNEAPKWTELRVYFNDLNRYFKGFFISSYIGLRKPDPKFYQKFLSDSGLKANKCVFMDDREENVEIARVLGFLIVMPNDISGLKTKFNVL